MEKACYGRSVWKAATGGSYFNKYLMGEDGCIALVCVCVCVFSSGGLVIHMRGYKCLHIYAGAVRKGF